MNRDLRNFRDSEHTERAKKFYDQHPEMCRYDCSYDWLFPVWQRFRDLKFDYGLYSDTPYRLHLSYKDKIAHAILNKPITEAHRLIWEGVKWLETIKKK